MLKDKFKEFMEKMCLGCHKECVIKKEVRECMLAYNDFEIDYLEEVLNENKYL